MNRQAAIDKLRIKSVLASVRVADSIPLIRLLDDATIGPVAKKHAAFVALRMRGELPFVAVRGNGTIEVRGAKGLDEASQTLHMARDLIARVAVVENGPLVPVVRNIVLTSDYGEVLPLTNLALSLDPATIDYEPEQFPGLIVSSPNERWRVLLFQSGKIVIVGVRSLDESRRVLGGIMDQLDNALS